ncbi:MULTISPECIES: DUF1360 domain-containing protein [Rhodococcus]|jgi:hypothetical protein|nr:MULTISPECIES: DUF1360 domain-containing protein [Rhodococcus]ETT26470.1 protein of unknown function DUF1360 [Rhodococcus rhodochrous ATCC 21198]NCL72999.1 hypothetical protein [Rhodococcus sp. YH1]AKE92437.1 hypothetical protein AAT18_08525 [Rhodococcus aetherivorans]ANZ28252.1 hypothetical protein A4U64_16055 [Rhodococcus sp. WB1]KDE14296.1 hypothetical protein N505_0105630 [Rhodococcus aetherivorans]
MSNQTDTSLDLAETARRHAREYTAGEDLPMRGYATVLAGYSTLVTVAVIGALVTGRRLPDRLSGEDLIVLALGTHKLSRTVTKDAVTSPLRAPFTRYTGRGGPAEVTEEVRGTNTLRHSLGELLTCPFCFDVWVATFFTIGMVFAPRPTRLVAGLFAALAGADFLQFAYAKAQQSVG